MANGRIWVETMTAACLNAIATSNSWETAPALKSMDTPSLTAKAKLASYWLAPWTLQTLPGCFFEKDRLQLSRNHPK